MITDAPLTETPLVVQGLTKSFRARTILEDVSFTARKGEITGLIGPNGSGKTTTLRCLLGLARPDSGRALVNGVVYRELVRPARLVGVVCENAGLHPALTAEDHIALARAAAGLPGRDPGDRLSAVGLGGCGRMKVRQMSLGMRQRLSLGIALVAGPEILVLDEPANGLDPEGIDWLRRLLRTFTAKGGTVLVTSHILSEMQRLVDAAVVIRSGRVVATADTPPPDLEAFYLSTARSQGD